MPSRFGLGLAEWFLVGCLGAIWIIEVFEYFTVVDVAVNFRRIDFVVGNCWFYFRTIMLPDFIQRRFGVSDHDTLWRESFSEVDYAMYMGNTLKLMDFMMCGADAAEDEAESKQKAYQDEFKSFFHFSHPRKKLKLI